ncbi:MAG: hypothetical protein HGA22_02645, partial [Clostridiales bacterium]|nr:hypothetical protein [Clostridiales bacterium]
EDIENDYLTTNIGNDGLRYLWYFDGSSELVIDPDGETVDSDGLF